MILINKFLHMTEEVSPVVHFGPIPKTLLLLK